MYLQIRMRSPDDELPPIDTTKPLDISEDEELERISSLLQRDSLVRSLGIVEQVHRLLHSTPGTTGLVKTMVPHGVSMKFCVLTENHSVSTVMQESISTYFQKF